MRASYAITDPWPYYLLAALISVAFILHITFNYPA